ncbi:MAG TPA: DegT/DnrJ/EryC1/StrS family aminotransferase, partial [Rhabdaerophilum sp.]|nr:DegT/DnrJ/EryC1/StrS family aminotransferase [Rhabdaerophilum sp.]
GNKIITTGGGGMIVTDDDAQAERLKHLTTTARVKDGWNFTHDEVGWNYRLPNINAAIGCAQLESLPGYVTAKRALAARYARDLAGMQGVRFFNERAGTHANFWLNAVLLDDRETRDRVLEETNAAGIETRPCWRLMHRLKPYEAAPRAGSLAGAEWIEDRLVNLPSSVKLGQGVLAAR